MSDTIAGLNEDELEQVLGARFQATRRRCRASCSYLAGIVLEASTNLG